MYARMFVVFLLGFLLSVNVATAACSNPYVVQAGDNLWSLSEIKLQDPLKWTQLQEQNPILKDRTRYSVDNRGRKIVLIKPGEQLCGLEAAGVDIGGFSVPILEKVSVDEPANPMDQTWRLTVFFLILLVLLAALVIYVLRKSQQSLQKRNDDPATAGPPMVPGGVTEANAEQALKEMAARRFGGGHQDFIILEHIAGRVFGFMLVFYRDRTRQEWMMAGQRAYQARVRRLDGHVEVIYMLQACGNDIMFGSITDYRPGEGFRFEPDPVASPAVAVPIVPPPVPEVAETEAQVVPGTIRLEVKPADDNGPNMVHVSGVNPVGASIEISPTGFKLRYTNLAQSRD